VTISSAVSRRCACSSSAAHTRQWAILCKPTAHCGRACPSFANASTCVRGERAGGSSSIAADADRLTT
jgi:hypothetical protein